MSEQKNGPVEQTIDQEMLQVLCGMVGQHCYDNSIDGGLNSWGLHDNCDALRFLAKLNIVVIRKEFGKTVLAEWKKP